MAHGPAIGLVFNFGGLIGQTEGSPSDLIGLTDQESITKTDDSNENNQKTSQDLSATDCCAACECPSCGCTECECPSCDCHDCGDCNCDCDCSSSIAIVGVSSAITAIAIKSAQAIESSKAQAVEKGFFHNLAIYLGWVVEIGPFYITAGACLGGFGCFAFGGGIKIGRFGVGVLFPFFKLW